MMGVVGKVFIGVDVGGTKTAVVVSSHPPETLGRIEFATLPEQGPERALQLIIESARSLLAEHGVAGEAIAGIGVSCGSPLDRVRGIIQAPPNLSTWVDVPIGKLLEEEFHVPCRVENDANAGAVAEHRFGAGVGAEHLIFLTLGTGLGAGIIAAGALYLGANGDAGEIGHVRLSPTGPVGYHKAGSIEGWASGGGIAQLAVSMVEQAGRRGRSSVLQTLLATNGMLTAREVGVAAQARDAVALSMLRRGGARLGQALAMVIDVLILQIIVLRGLARRSGNALRTPMDKVIA